MTATSQINETTLTLPYNARQTIEVAATNCNGTSGLAVLTYFEGGAYTCHAYHLQVILVMILIAFTLPSKFASLYQQ